MLPPWMVEEMERERRERERTERPCLEVRLPLPPRPAPRREQPAQPAGCVIVVDL